MTVSLPGTAVEVTGDSLHKEIFCKYRTTCISTREEAMNKCQNVADTVIKAARIPLKALRHQLSHPDKANLYMAAIVTISCINFCSNKDF